MMEFAQTILLVVQVFVALTLIGFILIQHGKGADAGAAFGSGASGTVFGSQGSGNFFTKVTTILAAVFLANSLALGYLAANRSAPASLLEDAELVEQVEKDAATEKLGEIIQKAAEEAEARGENLDAATDTWDPATTVEAIKESVEEEATDIQQDLEQQAEDLPALPQ